MSVRPEKYLGSGLFHFFEDFIKNGKARHCIYGGIGQLSIFGSVGIVEIEL